MDERRGNSNENGICSMTKTWVAKHWRTIALIVGFWIGLYLFFAGIRYSKSYLFYGVGLLWLEKNS